MSHSEEMLVAGVGDCRKSAYSRDDDDYRKAAYAALIVLLAVVVPVFYCTADAMKLTNASTVNQASR